MLKQCRRQDTTKIGATIPHETKNPARVLFPPEGHPYATLLLLRQSFPQYSGLRMKTPRFFYNITKKRARISPIYPAGFLIITKIHYPLNNILGIFIRVYCGRIRVPKKAWAKWDCFFGFMSSHFLIIAYFSPYYYLPRLYSRLISSAESARLAPLEVADACVRVLFLTG